jgi:homoserine kinase type II
VIDTGGAAKTELSLDELGRILQPFDLRPRRARALAAGTVNSNFRVDSDGGTLFVRVNENKSEADVRYEGALLWHLGARRFPTPQPLRRSDGQPYAMHGEKCITVFPWVVGTLVGENSVTVDNAGKVGRALGRLHKAAADFGKRRDGIYTQERIVRRIDRFRADPRVAEVIPILDEEAAWLTAHRAPSLPTGTIHGDLFPDNVLWSGGEIVALLDFEQASRGRFVYDLAVAALAWCWTGAALDEPRLRAMVAGYQFARPLENAERDEFLAEARFAALRFTVTRITDVFLPGLERAGKDYRDYLARLRWLREVDPALLRSWLSAAT